MKLYPETIRHYTGSIHKTEANTFSVQIRSHLLNFTKTFKTYGEALLEVYQLNVKNNLQIKNIIYDLGEYFEVCLTQNKHMKFDKEDLELIRDKVLYADRKSKKLYYARQGCGNGIQNEIRNHIPIRGVITVDHINGDGLDNRRQNLRIVDMSTQQRNIKGSRNQTGVVGLVYYAPENRYSARIKYNKRVYTKSFSANKYPNARELAIEWLESTRREIIPEANRVFRNL